MEQHYFTLQDLAARWECPAEAIVKLHDDIPEPDHPYGWCVETILMHEMRTGPQWPACIATLDTAKQVGFKSPALDEYKVLVFKQIYEWFGHPPKYYEARDIFFKATGVS